MKISSEQLTQFQEQGFLNIKGFYSSEDLSMFTNAVRKLIRFQCLRAAKAHANFPDIAAGEEFSTGLLGLDKVDHSYIADISDYIAFIPETLRLLSCPAFTSIVNQLLNNGSDTDSPLYITNTNPVLAMPQDTDYTYTWHKDTFYTIPESQYVQIWAPLVQDSTVETGTLRVCPGSHKNGWKGQEVVDGAPNRHRYKVSDDELAKFEKIDYPMSLGDVLFFDSGLAHASGCNSSNSARFSLVGVFHKIENDKIRPVLPQYAFQSKSPESYFQELYQQDGLQ